jgi:anti-anti-sigma factor
MTNNPLIATVRKLNQAAVIDLNGEIDSFGEQALEQAYDEAVSNNPEIIVLNFTDVGYMNSTGIALIVSLLAKARKSHRRLVTYGLSDHYVEIFQITRLADFMTIFPDEESALRITHPA